MGNALTNCLPDDDAPEPGTKGGPSRFAASGKNALEKNLAARSAFDDPLLVAMMSGGNPRRASTAGYESRRLSAANDPRRLANGAYSARPSAGVDDVQSAMADLQTRLRKSEERALKGEILVGKLRAFVAQQQPGPQPQPGDAVSWL